MTPGAILAMVPNIAGLATFRARQRAVSMRYEDVSLLSCYIHINLANVPGFLKAEKGSVNFRVAHEA